MLLGFSGIWVHAVVRFSVSQKICSRKNVSKGSNAKISASTAVTRMIFQTQHTDFVATLYNSLVVSNGPWAVKFKPFCRVAFN